MGCGGGVGFRGVMWSEDIVWGRGGGGGGGGGGGV